MESMLRGRRELQAWFPFGLESLVWWNKLYNESKCMDSEQQEVH